MEIKGSWKLPKGNPTCETVSPHGVGRIAGSAPGGPKKAVPLVWAAQAEPIVERSMGNTAPTDSQLWDKLVISLIHF